MNAKPKTTREYLVQIYERLDVLTNKLNKIEVITEKNKEEILIMKIKVIAISSAISVIVSALFLIFRKLFNA